MPSSWGALSSRPFCFTVFEGVKVKANMMKTTDRKLRYAQFLSILFLAVVPHVQVYANTSALAANCRSIGLGNFTGTIPNIGAVINYVTTYDDSTGFPLVQDLPNGTFYVSQELRPRAGQPGFYEAAYITYTTTGLLEQYGRFTANLPTADSDGNGLPDVVQPDISGNASFTGDAESDWPMSNSFTLSGHLARSAGSTAGTYTLVVNGAAGPVNYTGTFYLLYVSGSITYFRGIENGITFNLTRRDQYGNTTTLTGSTAFTVSNTNQVLLPQFTLFGSDGTEYTTLALLLNRSGTKYSGDLQLLDGNPQTSWPDYTDWFVSITDTNDANGNGIPDLSDNISLPPAITLAPQSQTVNVGQTVNFSVTASGTAPLTYQWQFDGAKILGATSSTLTLTNVQTGEAGSYTAVVTNSFGSVTSTVASLTVTMPMFAPSIFLEPESQTVISGQNVTFNVDASGTPPLTYQWRFNGANLPSTNSASLTISGVQAGNAGFYSVLVSNAKGSVLSFDAQLTVLIPPTITTQPNGQAVNRGSTVIFLVQASSTTPLSYQWRFNGTNITAGTSSMLTLTNVQVSQMGEYDVIVSNVAGATMSAEAELLFNWILTATASRGGTVSLVRPSYAPNSTTFLTAIPLPWFVFGGWTGDASGTNNPLPVLMDRDKTIMANFTIPAPRLSILNSQAGDNLQFFFSAVAGETYQIEGSADLLDWTGLAIVQATNSQGRYQILIGNTRAFFRVVWAP